MVIQKKLISFNIVKKKKKMYRCDRCFKKYIYYRGLIRHKREKHLYDRIFNIFKHEKVNSSQVKVLGGPAKKTQGRPKKVKRGPKPKT